MKLVSKFLVAVSAMLLTSAASAGTLYWQVDDNSGDVAAELWLWDTSLNEGQGGQVQSLSGGLLDAPTGIQQADITAYANDSKYRFYVELVNFASGTSTDGYKWSYNELYESGYVAMGATDIPTVNANVGAHSNFAQTPEPSSGLLLLMGGAMLALRRRRQK